MTDTHAHLDACEEPADELVARAREAGVRTIVSVGSGLESCRETLAIAARHEAVFAALGIHPHQAADADADRLAELRELLDADSAVAVGETGLDYYRDYAPRDRQLALFERQLELATELGKPVVVHTRAASNDTAAALEPFVGTVVLHCFSAPQLLRVRVCDVEELRDAARVVPADRLLVETDSPYLSPQPRRGRPNEPANVVHTAAVLATARGTDPAALSAQLDANAAAAFVLP